MELKAGLRLQSAVCDAEVIVVKAPSEPVDLTCGGAPMLALGESGPSAQLDQSAASGTLIGKRYADEERGLELLCTKSGEGSLACNGFELLLKAAKPLPSSD